MSNPFDTSNEGPRHGNAYEDTNVTSPSPAFGVNTGSPALPPRNMPHQTNIATSSPYGTQRMPSPSDYHQPATTNNAWQESNKTLDEDNRNAWSASPQPQNAYQYTGTQYGNTSNTNENVYSPQMTSATPHETTGANNSKIETPMAVSDAEATYNTNSKNTPSKRRLLLRFILLVAAIGHLGFAAGASPVSSIVSVNVSNRLICYLFSILARNHLSTLLVFTFFSQW